MSDLFRSGVSRFVLSLIALLSFVPAVAAITAPPVTGKPSLGIMVDARVNLKASYNRATAARTAAVTAGALASRQQARNIAEVIVQHQRALPGLDVKLYDLTGAPSEVSNRGGALTAAAAGRGSEDIVREFLTKSGDIYGLSSIDVSDLVVLGDSPGGDGVLRMLRMEQQIDGLPVFQSETRFLLDRDGRLMKTVGLMVPHARSFAPQIDPARLMTPGEAVSHLMEAEGRTVDPLSFSITPQGSGRLTLTPPDPDGFILGSITARQVLFPLAPGLLVPAWSLVVFTGGDQDWYAIVDAETGDLLWRKGIRDYASAHDARFRVYVQADGTTPADSPAPQSPNNVTPGSGTQFPEIAPVIVSMHTAYDATASPNGWIDDCPGGVCTAAQTQTLGNNVSACLDRDGTGNNVCDTTAASVLDGNGRPMGNPDANTRNRDFLGTAPRDFQTNYLPPPQGGNPEAGQTSTGNGNNGTLAIDQYRRGIVTQLFYVVNWYHDQLFKLGFDEASGNFQATNFSGMGLGNDRVNADAQDGNGTNNANFATPPDGTSGRAQMYRFTGPTIDRDGDIDSEILMHELTHGTSNRLVGNAVGLNWDPARGMGEGWSDFVAMSLLNNTNADNPNGQYGSGAWATYKLIAGFTDNYLYGIRRFPYTTNHAINPMTWADVDDVTNNLGGGIAPTPINFNGNGGMEVHNSGEIWALTLWGVRARVIADPAGANGDVPTGNHTMLLNVINGLKMTPVNPTFTDGRDAIIQADCATNACANETSIWDGFADRGLGYGAQSPFKVIGRYASSHQGIHESFSSPFLDVVNPLTDVAIDDSADNNNGAIDPGEAIKLTVSLTNPWRGATKAVASATGTLTTSTPGVTIYDNTAAWGAIAPQAKVAAGDTFLITVDPTVACGSSIDFTLTTTSASLGTTVATFRLRVGNRNGTDPVVTYTGDPNPDLTIVNGQPRGVLHQINVTDDFEIADLNYRVDSITHPAVGDLSALLRAPFGIGTDLIVLIDGLNDLGGTSITNMVIDDDVPLIATNDMVQATAANAPYTKSWNPVYNSPWAALVDPARPGDPVGNLSRYKGLSTKGTWSTIVADVFTAAQGGADGNGTLNAWSILVTPVHFDCTAFAATALVTATKTVTGTFSVGGTVTYTVTLTNTGTANQADNAGHEFTDTLSPSLTLVSAIASSGTAGTTGNTVNWDGSLAPLGGSVTITITATVNAGTQGTTICNQGTASYDSNNDGTNDATVLTDDPSVGGAADPTCFNVPNAAVTATKTVSGTFKTGGTITYTIVLSNSGSAASPDNAGHELTDALSSSLTLVSAVATGGTATTAGNTANWDGSIPAGGSITITITATVNAGTQNTTICNQASFAFDADLDGTNESTGTTDDPAVGGANDPTCFDVQGAHLTATKTASGTFVTGSTVTYTIVISNDGNTDSLDTPAVHEFTDTLPASLTLVSASATSGTVTPPPNGNTVTWDGIVPAGGSVTITITATINQGNALSTVTNQGTVTYDSDLDGTNDTTVQTDDPGVGGATDPTAFVVAPGVAAEVPTLSTFGLLGLSLLLIGAAWTVLRRRTSQV